MPTLPQDPPDKVSARTKTLKPSASTRFCMEHAIAGFAIGTVAGGGLGYALGRTAHPTIYGLCVQMEKGALTPEQFVKDVYATIGRTPDPASVTYWTARYRNPADSELNTNLYADSQVPIVGLNSADSTRPRTLAALIVRAQISKSATGTLYLPF